MEKLFEELIQSIAKELFPQNASQSYELAQELIKRFESELIFSLEQLQFMKHEHYKSCKISIGLEAKFRQILHERNFLSIFSPTTPAVSSNVFISTPTTTTAINPTSTLNTLRKEATSTSNLAPENSPQTPTVTVEPMQLDPKPITTDGWIHYAEELRSVIPKNAQKSTKTKSSKRKQTNEETDQNNEQRSTRSKSATTTSATNTSSSTTDTNHESTMHDEENEAEEQAQPTKRKTKAPRKELQETSSTTPSTAEEPAQTQHSQSKQLDVSPSSALGFVV